MSRMYFRLDEDDEFSKPLLNGVDHQEGVAADQYGSQVRLLPRDLQCIVDTSILDGFCEFVLVVMKNSNTPEDPSANLLCHQLHSLHTLIFI